jgi:hypothetical protein
VSYADDHVRGFFFCLRVQEYDFGKGAVEAGNAAIEYMESVPGIVPKEYGRRIAVPPLYPLGCVPVRGMTVSRPRPP